MDVLVPLCVALPLVVAAALSAAGHFLGRRADDLAAIPTAGAVAAMCVILLVESADSPIHYFFGGWEPRKGVALGIAFSVDPVAASLAALAATLTAASLVFSWRYFDEVGTLFHVLVLGFLGGMVGFAFSGDLFNMFVFFELMGVCAFALTAYRIDRPGPLQGALNFAVTNTIGAFLILGGLALLYGRTGALNVAQVGEALARHRADGLVITAFLFLVVGFLVKAGAVPFHFWLSDAYGVAPIPVCVLLSGAMSDMGIHGVSRVYWTIFAGALGEHAASVRAVLVAVGVLTALVGAGMSFLEAELKRMLAFVTISHVGIFLVGTALLTPDGLAGRAIYVVADGLVKGGLFLAVGMILYRLKTGSELALHGRGRALPFVGLVFAAGALALAGLPPFGTFLGVSLIEESARQIGYGWLPAVIAVAVAVAAGSALRAAGRIFLGLGERRDSLLTELAESEEEEEPEKPGKRSPLVMLLPATALVVVGLGLAFAPGLAGHAERAAAHAQDRAAYAAELLHDRKPAPAPEPPARRTQPTSWGYGAGSTAGAVAVALLGLYRRRLPRLVLAPAARALGPPVAVLRTVHSGVIGDYVAWLTVGAAGLGVLFVATLR